MSIEIYVQLNISLNDGIVWATFLFRDNILDTIMFVWQLRNYSLNGAYKPYIIVVKLMLNMNFLMFNL